jgi:Bifunctional DNA primase/polymerase, N-terminal
MPDLPADPLNDPRLLACGPPAALFYTQNGLRVVAISPETKAAARRGFGKDCPDYTTPPGEFARDELVAILMGPCPLGAFAGGRLLCGLDLDAPFDRAALELRTGPLPETLSSKKGRHLYFWITRAQQEKGELTQGNDVFRTKMKNEGALDLRPAAGGYFLERGDWDGRFDRSRIADLPDQAHAVLLAARTTRRGKPQATCVVPLDRYADGERTPMNELGEAALDDIARVLAGVWPRPGQGGGHDLALALGGVLADAWGSLDDICDLAARVFHYAQAPDATQEVLASVAARRTGAANAFGWPTLNRMLIDANPGIDPAIVKSALTRLKHVPGLDASKATRFSAIAAFRAAGCPGAYELGLKPALAAFTKQWKANGGNTTAPDALCTPGAVTTQKAEE